MVSMMYCFEDSFINLPESGLQVQAWEIATNDQTFQGSLGPR